MQLFVTEYTKKENIIIIANIELLSQVRKVLRASIGDRIRIQSPHLENHKTRYEVRIEVWDNKTLEGTIVSQQDYVISDEKRSMIISMPNKWDKIELIVQKLTECGLGQIIFWPSERSVIKEWNTKKEERLHKIIKEAVEQSRWWNVPHLGFATDIKQYLQDTDVVVFDKPEKKEQTKKQQGQVAIVKSHITGIIWPEWGFTDRDYDIFAGTTYDVYWLGETVLRTETAAIVWWRILKNNFK